MKTVGILFIAALTTGLMAGKAHCADPELTQAAADKPKTVPLDIGSFNLEVNRSTGSDAIELQLGDDISAVADAYGKPLGKANLGETQILMYPRGQVEILGDKVVAIKMISQKSYEEKQIRRANRITLEKEIAEKEKADKRQVAEDKLAKVLSDPEFDEKSAIDKVSFWRKFKKEHPEINVEPFFKEALANLNTKVD